jgi:hypothetical protein
MKSALRAFNYSGLQMSATDVEALCTNEAQYLEFTFEALPQLIDFLCKATEEYTPKSFLTMPEAGNTISFPH